MSVVTIEAPLALLSSLVLVVFFLTMLRWKGDAALRFMLLCGLTTASLMFVLSVVELLR